MFRGQQIQWTLGVIFFVAIFLVLPFMRWDALPDPDFAPRYLLLGGILTIIMAIQWLSSFKLGQAHFCSIPRFSLWTLFAWWCWAGIMCIAARNTGAAVAEWLRYGISMITILVIAQLLNTEPLLRRQLPRLAILNFAVMSISFFVQWCSASNHTGHFWFVDYRFGGLAGNKNFLSEVVLFNSFFLLPGLRSLQRMERYVVWIAVIGSLVLIAWLQTQAVWFALAVVSVMATIQHPTVAARRWQGKSLLALTVFLTAITVYSTVSPLRVKVNRAVAYLQRPIDVSEADTLNGNSVYERLLLWRNSLKMIAEQPLFGSGLTNWKTEQMKFGVGGTAHLNNGYVGFEHPHNEYLLIWSEQGLVGLVVFLCIIFVCFWISPLQTSMTEDDLVLLRSSRYAVIAFLTVACFAYPMSRDLSWVLMCVHIGVLLSIQRSSMIPNRLIPRWVFFSCMVICGVALFASLKQLSGEYHTGQCFAAQLKKQPSRACREAMAGISFFYSVDRTGTSLRWYAGDAAYRSGDTLAALQLLQHAREEQPYHIKLLNDLGTIYEQVGQTDSAILCYRKALVISPSFVEAQLNLAATYYNTGSIKQAFVSINSITQPERLKGRDRKNYDLFLPAILLRAVMEDSILYAQLQHAREEVNLKEYYTVGDSQEDYLQSLRAIAGNLNQ